MSNKKKIILNERIKKLLVGMRDRPAAFFGKKSLERLSFSLSGYMLCLCELGESDTTQYLPGFNEFVAKRYGIKSAHNWCSIIQFYHSIEEDAYDTFFELIDEFYGKDWDK